MRTKTLRNWLCSLTCLVASCAGIGPPPTVLAQIQGQEVYWIYMNFQLLRCWQHQAGAPVCMRVKQIPNPLESRADDIEPLVRAAQPTPAPVRRPAVPPVQRDTGSEQYPDYSQPH